MIIVSDNEITVTATDIRTQPTRENDTEIHVTVMRSCTFLSVRHNGRQTAHIDISPEDWRKIASTPRPVDDPAEDAAIELAIQDHAREA